MMDEAHELNLLATCANLTRERDEERNARYAMQARMKEMEATLEAMASPGVNAIAVERRRQIHKGYTPYEDAMRYPSDDDTDLLELARLLLSACVSGKPAGWSSRFAVHAIAKYRGQARPLLAIVGALAAAELDRLNALTPESSVTITPELMERVRPKPNAFGAPDGYTGTGAPEVG